MRIDENYQNKQTNKQGRVTKTVVQKFTNQKNYQIICALRRGSRFCDFL